MLHRATKMMSQSSKVLFYVLMSAILLVTLDADDFDCTTDLKVKQNTVYEVHPGQQLRIDCPVKFCNNLPPAVSWYKTDEQNVRISVNGNNHMKAGWEMEKPLEGTSYLIFLKILRKDSGRYRCKSGGSVSHIIYVIVLDEGCVTELRVRRNTVHKAILEQELRIECPVVFCNNLQPTVSWHRIEDKSVIVNGSNHIKTGWEVSNPLEGTSYLIFQKILRKHAGGYRCQSGGSVSHIIYVTVIGSTTPTTTVRFQLWGNSTSESTADQDMFWHYLYRIIGMGTCFIILISMCIVPWVVLKGRCSKTADPCPQSSEHISENP